MAVIELVTRELAERGETARTFALFVFTAALAVMFLVLLVSDQARAASF